jgi:hypothetical protein
MAGYLVKQTPKFRQLLRIVRKLASNRVFGGYLNTARPP